LANDDEHYQRIKTMSRSNFLLELVTFVETTLSERDKKRQHALKKNG